MVLGGTLTEIAIANRAIEPLMGWIDKLGLEYVEVSDGTITLEADVKRELIERLSRENHLRHSLSDYESRLTAEIQMIQKMRFAGYFLIVWDFIRYARAQEVPVGPGRGSAAGSLVSYALQITDVDPLQYDLLFERFLNPERVSMPDIDIDFCMRRRGEVIDYVRKTFGEKSVAQIMRQRIHLGAGIRQKPCSRTPGARSICRMAKWTRSRR